MAKIAKTRRPSQGSAQIDGVGPIDRIGIVGCFGWNCKTPDVTFPWAIRVSFIDFVDSPIVGCPRYETFRISISGKAGNIKFGHLVAAIDVCVARSVVHNIVILSQIHVVRDR